MDPVWWEHCQTQSTFEFERHRGFIPHPCRQSRIPAHGFCSAVPPCAFPQCLAEGYRRFPNRVGVHSTGGPIIRPPSVVPDSPSVLVLKSPVAPIYPDPPKKGVTHRPSGPVCPVPRLAPCGSTLCRGQHPVVGTLGSQWSDRTEDQQCCFFFA